MSGDLFQSEQAVLDEALRVLDAEEISDQTEYARFAALTKSYRKLFRDTRRLVRLSDRSDEKLKKAETQIKAQNSELEDAHSKLSRQTEILEIKVKERTRDLATARTKLESLVERGIALSVEQDEDKLLEMILLAAMELSSADGGTLYMREEEALRFEIMRNESLGIAMGGTTGEPIPFPAVQLRDAETGAENHRNVASHAALSLETVVIDDAYETEEFDLSGTRAFDKQTGYRSMFFLTVPLIPRGSDVIGVLQ